MTTTPTVFTHTTRHNDILIADTKNNRLTVAQSNGNTTTVDVDHDTLVQMSVNWTPVA